MPHLPLFTPQVPHPAPLLPLAPSHDGARLSAANLDISRIPGPRQWACLGPAPRHSQNIDKRPGPGDAAHHFALVTRDVGDRPGRDRCDHLPELRGGRGLRARGGAVRPGRPIIEVPSVSAPPGQ